VCPCELCAPLANTVACKHRYWAVDPRVPDRLLFDQRYSVQIALEAPLTAESGFHAR